LDSPSAGSLGAHLFASQLTIAFVDLTPMNFVSKFHPSELGADLCAGEFFELIFRERANFKSN
jgi:hypothetical protein